MSHTTSYSNSLTKRDSGAVWNPGIADVSSRALKMNSKYSNLVVNHQLSQRKQQL